MRAKITSAIRPKMNSGIDTPTIPKIVNELSRIEPRFRALIEPKITPRKVDISKAETDSSRVAGIRSKTNF